MPGVSSVLGLSGLLGALFAGVVADSVLRMGEDDGDDATTKDTLTDASEQGETSKSLSLLFEVETNAVPPNEFLEGDGMPLSSDTLQPIDLAQTLRGSLVADNLNGAGGDDQIYGGAGDDLLGGRGGADWLAGDAGHDHLRGGEGADSLFGGVGADVLHGEDGTDTLVGGDGRDELFGHEGDDDLQGGVGDDALQGGNGFDRLSGGDGADEMNGGYGRDLLGGGRGFDVLDGGDGSDTIWGQMPDEADSDADFLYGGTGDDLLMLGQGDFGNGGDGADVFGLLDVIPGDPPMQITDFDPMADALVVLYDPALHPDPQLTVKAGENGAMMLHLDGVALASLTNGAMLDLQAIVLRAV